jgi:glutamyl-tRNA synthetase
MRVRFAPSPTGALHIGGARTALFNWLLARHSGGQLVLRIEDTDRERSTPENVEQILDALAWLELDWDEGPILQTSRTERHQQALLALLESGHAYRSNANAADVKAFKALYGAERGFRGEPQSDGAVRLRVPNEGATVVHDVIRGETSFEHVHLDDPVIARADGSVLYNFAVAIDDLDAGITHVVRGEDHLSNTPKQVLVLDAARESGLAPDAPLPVYAHLPLLHGPDGKKLSKRHGAASVQELRDAGYLPEAVRNYLALLGWGAPQSGAHPEGRSQAGDDATMLSTDELVERFTLERVSRNPARFDEVKLRWLDGLYIRELPVQDLANRLEAFTGRSDLLEAARISQEKIQTLADFWPLAGSLLDGPSDDPKARERWLDDGGRAALAEVSDALAASASFDEDAVREALSNVIARREAKPREVYQPLRVALTGTTISPGIFESVALLGREETLRRIASVTAPA